MSDSSNIADGSIFAGRYQVVRCIARGGMGAIYEVIHLETQRRRALKVILPEVLQSAELRERFRQEARVAAQVDSEHIVDVFDAGVDESRKMPFLVMELLKGEELGVRLERMGKFEPSDVVMYLRQTALALDKTHAANIVHRDLKPENLYLTQRDDGQPRIKVLDFGIAKVLADGATRSQATRSIGTPLYMGPEQFSAGSHVSPATDIYALGMIAYTLLVGAPYFLDEAEQAGNMFAFAGVVIAGPKELASVRARRRGISLPPAFDAWFSQVTSLDPKRRPQRATQAIDQLANALGVDISSRKAMPSSPLFPSTPPPVPPPAPPVLPVHTPQQTAPPITVAMQPAHQTVPIAAGSSPVSTTAPPKKSLVLPMVTGALVLMVGGSFVAWKVLQDAPASNANPGVVTSVPATSNTPSPPEVPVVPAKPSASAAVLPVTSAVATPSATWTAKQPVAPLTTKKTGSTGTSTVWDRP